MFARVCCRLFRAFLIWILYSYSHLMMAVLGFRASVKYVRLPSHQSGEFVAFCPHLFINIFSASASIYKISPLNQDQTWEFSHPKFIRGRPDLLHEIKLSSLELHWNDVGLPEEVVSLNSVSVNRSNLLIIYTVSPGARST